MKAKDIEARNAKKNAAHMLMKEYVTKHVDDVARILSGIIPFFHECSQEGLQSSMNTVNVTFASLALDVIKSTWDEEDDYDRISLPVDAEDMKSAIFYLSKLVDKMAPLSAHVWNNINDPAINLCIEANGDCDILGAV